MLKSDAPLKVLFLDKGRWWGGAEACLVGMVQGFDARRIRTEICVDYPMPHHERYRAAGASVIARFASEKIWMRTTLKKRIRGLDFAELGIGALRLYAMLRRHPFDIVHINLLRNRSQDALAARLGGARVVGHVRHLSSQVPMGRAVLDRCDAVICASDVVRHDLLATGTRTRLVKIYDGVDARPFQLAPAKAEARRRFGLPPDGLVVGCPAVLEARKGQDVAIEAMALLERRANVRLVVAGGEPLGAAGVFKRTLEDMATKAVLGSCIHFLGHVDDMPELYAACDIVLALSRDGEAYGRVPVEAAMAGTPVIATRIGATPEIVIDGATGFLVAPGNPAEVAARLETLLSDEGLRARMGRSARTRATETFGYRRGLGAIETLYRQLIHR